jgi:hypothetical protein
LNDLLIRNATLYDGSGADPQLADLSPKTPSKSSTPTASR